MPGLWMCAGVPDVTLSVRPSPYFPFLPGCVHVYLQDDWAKVKTAIAERKLRGAANTNNTDLVETLLSGHLASVKSVDEHKRSALHFAAAKVISPSSLWSSSSSSL